MSNKMPMMDVEQAKIQLVVPAGIGLPADEQPAPLKLNGGDGVRPAELHVPAGVADSREDSVSTSFHAEDSSTTK